MKTGFEVGALFVVGAPIVMEAPVVQVATLISNTRRGSNSNSGNGSGRGTRNRGLGDPGVSVDQPLLRGRGLVRRDIEHRKLGSSFEVALSRG